MQHVIWEMYKIPFLIIAFFVGLAIWSAAILGLVVLVRYMRSNPYEEMTPGEQEVADKKRAFFEE